MSDHIDIGLHRLEIAFKVQDREKIALFADILRRKHINDNEMGEAVVGCIEFSKFFPSVKEILSKARPNGQGLPPSDAHPIWNKPEPTHMEKCRAQRDNLAACLDVYRRQNRQPQTIAAVERDIAKLDREIEARERLAIETAGMGPEDAANYAIEFWGGARHLPNVMRMLAAKGDDRNLRGPELWQGEL
jgi:hypothetical protein